MVKLKPYSPSSIKEVLKQAKSATTTAISGLSYNVNSSGSVGEKLAIEIDTTTGFWPQKVRSKAPRFLLHIEVTEDEFNVSFPSESDGTEFSSARQIGYLNNREGRCAVFMSRILPVFKTADGSFEYFEDWEWVLAVAFAQPLAVGTSGERLTDFNPDRGSIKYQNKEYSIAHIGLVKSPTATKSRRINDRDVAYDDITDALASFLNPQQVEPATEAEEQPNDDASVREQNSSQPVRAEVASLPFTPTPATPEEDTAAQESTE